MTKEELYLYVNRNISPLNEAQLDKLETLVQVTLSENKKFNLTAIKNEEDFRELMVYDSLIPLKYFNFEGKRILDVGTGGGFPGLPLAICSTGNFVLLDSTQKKIDHINNFINENRIPNAMAVSYRVEEFADYEREEFDYVIARAVAPLNILMELCLPLVKVGGTFIALKGSNAEEEIKQSSHALKALNASIDEICLDKLPIRDETRILIKIKKERPTANKYPRDYAEIKRNPL